MAGHKGNSVSSVEALAEPVAQSLGLLLWDVEFVKEGAAWYLRLYIDKDEGVTIEDCEAFSKLVDKRLDEVDPIEQSYYLEVSSPGVERELKKDWHFEAMQGNQVKVMLFRPIDGKKEIIGTLIGLENGVVKIETEQRAVEVNRHDASHIRIYEDDLFG